MKYLVVYVHDRGIGSVDCKFRHNPPTAKDVRDAEKELKEKFRIRDACIVNWLEISEEESEDVSCTKNDGWIPVESEEKPPAAEYIYLSFANFDLPMVGRYEEDETGGAFYIGDDEETCISQDMIVNAWKPVDKPYRPKEEMR